MVGRSNLIFNYTLRQQSLGT